MSIKKLKLSLETETGEILKSNCMGLVLHKCGIIKEDSYAWMPPQLLRRFFKVSTKKESDIILMVSDNKLVHIAIWAKNSKRYILERPGYNSTPQIILLKSSMRRHAIKYGKINNIYMKKKD